MVYRCQPQLHTEPEIALDITECCPGTTWLVLRSILSVSFSLYFLFSLLFVAVSSIVVFCSFPLRAMMSVCVFVYYTYVCY